MFRFLHIADVHLGHRQYKLLERERDFFEAFLSCMQGAIKEQVDFVILVGDIFDTRNISAETFNQVCYVLELLNQAQIPVIAIEGNHDHKESNHHASLKGSWFEALAKNKLLYFLYPIYQENELILRPLIFEQNYLKGSYLDLNIKNKQIRFIGSRWNGYNSSLELKNYAKQIQLLNQLHPVDFSIFLFHNGHSDYVPVNRGGVTTADFLQLRPFVDHIALGHIHEHYIISDYSGKDFIFNPGSLEANSTAVIRNKNYHRGALLVDVSADHTINAKLYTDYKQREFIRLDTFQAQNFSNLEDLLEFIYQTAIQHAVNNKPILLLKIITSSQYQIVNNLLNQLIDRLKEYGFLHILLETVDHEQNSWKHIFDEKSELSAHVEIDILQKIIKEEPLPDIIKDTEIFLQEMQELKNYQNLEAEKILELIV